MLWPLILELADKTKLSDIHIHSDAPIAYREFGDMVQLEHIVEAEHIREFLQEVLNDDDFSGFVESKDHDFAIEKDGKRFRVNAFQESEKFALILRRIESDLPNFDDLGLPAYIRTVPTLDTGLVLVTGETGSGKSTTLAALIDVINATKKGHIITIEDPIEFQHNSKASVMTQREVGRDTKSFTNALRAALREDPDVILVGELRDVETISLALTAAETGHLVFGTLHTSGAPATINRIIDVFPPGQQEQIRAQISTSLKMVVTQRLLKTKDGQGRCAAFEIMKCTPPIQNLIREGKVHQIPSVIQTSTKDGMLEMRKSLEDLVRAGKIDGSITKEN